MEVLNKEKKFKNIFIFLKSYKRIYMILSIFLICRVFVDLSFAKLLMDIIDSATRGEMNSVIKLLKYGVVLILSYSLLNYLYIFSSGSYTALVKNDIRNKLYLNIFKNNLEVFKDKASGDLISRIMNDVNVMSESLINNILMVIFIPVMAIGSIIYIFYLNWKLSIFALFLGPFIIILSFIFGNLINKYSKNLFIKLSNLNDLLIDSFTGRKIVKLFSLENLFHSKNENQNMEIYKLEKKISNLNAIFQSCIGIVVNFSFVLSIGFGAYLIVKNEISIGILIAFVTLLNHVIEPFTSLGSIISNLSKAISATNRVYEIVQIKDNFNCLSNANIENIKQKISLKNLKFYYGEKIVLDDVSITIPIGKTIAIVGPSGSGKSTLLNILLKLENEISGEMLFDEISINNLHYNDIKHLFSMVNQDGYLFKGTIKENISYGNPKTTMEEIIAAAKIAEAHDFIMNLPQGYETIYGENNILLSGGQKQRISIARAIIKNSPIIVLDEAMTGLDNRTQNLIKENLKSYLKGKTIIIVTHKIINIKEADKIIVMKDGKVIEEGTHETLMKTRGLYYELGKETNQVKCSV